MADRLFLDANVLFSAAYGSPGIERLWDAQRAGSCRLLVSRFVIEEARRNLRKTEQTRRLDDKLESAVVVPESPADRCPLDLPDKDRPVFSAAMAARATHLITGDRRHFGAYYGATVAGVTILRPSEYLRAHGELPLTATRCPHDPNSSCESLITPDHVPTPLPAADRPEGRTSPSCQQLQEMLLVPALQRRIDQVLRHSLQLGQPDRQGRRHRHASGLQHP